ncbi:hypothetical protein JNL27_05515 [bacterium]|nr:hypothetical protein [bacterium]
MNKVILFMTVLTFAVVAGCGGGGGGSKVTITKADNLFDDGDYQDAQDAYVSLIASEGAPAIAGAAWCSIRLHNYAQADSFFSAAGVTLNADGLAGWSFASWALNDPQDALDHATAALAANPAFTTLSIDPLVTSNHLIWIQASSYLQLDNPTECYNKIHLLDAGFAMPTGNAQQIASALLTKLTSLGVAVG